MITACDFWPRALDPLAESVSARVSGEASVWLLGGDVLIIDVTNSPLYGTAESELETVAVETAEDAVASVEAPLESIVITFHEAGLSEDPGRRREFLFLVLENRPVLQAVPDFEATGPLTRPEIETLIMDRMDTSFTGDQAPCVLKEAEQLARDAGDPETLDPSGQKFLSSESWGQLDPFGRRLILAQALTTEAMFTCIQPMSE